MSNEIKYSFNIGDKVKVIQSSLFTGILKGATGIITDELNNNGMMSITNGFNLKIIEPASFKGEIWRLSCFGEFELIETTNFEGCERLQYKDSKKYKTIVKNGFIEFRKIDDYIEFENGSKIKCIGGITDNIRSKRGNEWFKNNVITIESARESYVCVKDCIYKAGSKIEIMRKVKDFIIVTDGKNINPFRESEFEEYFAEYIDVNKISFKMVDTKQIKVIKSL